LDSFHDDEVDDDPRADQTEKHPPLDANEVVNASADVLESMLQIFSACNF
jgi:hypothetical protein